MDKRLTSTLALLLTFALGLPAFGQNFVDESMSTEPFLAEEFEFDEEEEEIETDRDSFTPATTTAGYPRTIVEAAYSFVDNRSVPETHSFPELLVRYGVNDWLELRFGENYEVGGAGSPVSGNVPSDLNEENELEYEHRLIYGSSD